MILESPALAALPGIRHGFSTRLGGVSEGEFGSLNLGRTVGDDPARVAENARRFRLLLGLSPETAFAETDQVHGTALFEATQGGAAAVEADGIATRCAGLPVGVRTADCAPLLFADRDARKVAAVHAGWRGATAGIALRTVEHFQAAGIAPADLVVAIGPTIGLEEFEVGPEVIEAASFSLGGPAPSVRLHGKNYLDLRKLLVLQLGGAGVRTIDLVGGSTAGEPALYFSHRRDRGRTGRHLSVIWREAE